MSSDNRPFGRIRGSGKLAMPIVDWKTARQRLERTRFRHPAVLDMETPAASHDMTAIGLRQSGSSLRTALTRLPTGQIVIAPG